ncbi:mas-related G-protein coupled receptor member X2-like [Talpa occidentalis]|uniref:mas-related G-protein coupled receptor member X2-like n=1 Tax=Talpa occidentalis TaxID=50954 RepID=UPI0023F90B1B|nr:mas-related G-protein coupled receptor member X2-like [Talpa occidentalis]
MEERDTSGSFLSIDPTMTRNGTDLDLSGNFDFESLILDLLYLIIAVIGLAGNAAVLWQLCFRTQRNTFSIYILNLAAADVLYLILQIIFSLQGLITSSQFSSSSIANFLSTVTTLACIANLSILSAISTERCLSVLCPTWYRSCHPRHMSAVVCALLWALSLLLSILEGFYCDILEEDTDDG